MPRGAVTETNFVALGADTDGWSAELGEQLERLGPAPTRLVLDVTAADEIDATGVATLVLALKRVEGGGGELRLVCDQPETRNLLQLTGLDRFFRRG
jgi:anti-sigma B factor antagonist